MSSNSKVKFETLINGENEVLMNYGYNIKPICGQSTPEKIKKQNIMKQKKSLTVSKCSSMNYYIYSSLIDIRIWNLHFFNQG